MTRRKRSYRAAHGTGREMVQMPLRLSRDLRMKLLATSHKGEMNQFVRTAVKILISLVNNEEINTIHDDLTRLLVYSSSDTNQLVLNLRNSATTMTVTANNVNRIADGLESANTAMEGTSKIRVALDNEK